MSSSDATIADVRAQNTVDRRNMIGMLRLMAIRVTSKPFWQGVGVRLVDGVTKETRAAPVFSGIGFYSRPRPGANAEGIMAHVGGPENPCWIATRDEDLRNRAFPKSAPLDQDETAAFNAQAVMHITKAGKILAYLVGHLADAVGLAKTSELNDLRAFVHAQFSGVGHGHPAPGGATTGTTPVGVAPATDYPGTTVLKGQ
jgi:hypothetical protein